MRHCIPIAVALMVGLSAAQPAMAQSALKRLEELIRSGQPSAAPEEAPSAGAPSVPPPARPAPAAAGQEKGYLGVVADDREDRGRGVRVLEVKPVSPADIAGFRPNDLITSVGGIRVREMDELAAVLAEMAPGDVLEFDILRDERSRKIEVTFGRRAKPEPGGLEELITPQPQLQVPTLDADEVQDDSTSPPPLFKIPLPAKSPQADKPTADRALIEKLQHRIEELERRVKALEASLEKKDGEE